MTNVTAAKKATAAELKSIASRYQSLIDGYHACTTVKGLRCWLMSAESAIDESVRILDKGVSKANESNRLTVANLYGHLQGWMARATAKIGDADNGPV